MTIVNFGDCETYPELSCQDINNDTNVALINEALNFFREGIIKVTKKDEDDIRSKLSLLERLIDDEVIELKQSIQMPTNTLQNKLKTNITNSKQTPRSYAEKRKKEIDSYVEEMRRAMQSNLGLIADKAIADIRKFLKKNGVKGISELELKSRDYLTILNKKIAFLAIKGWSNAEKLLNEAKNDKKKKTTATLDDEEINELPVVLRSFVKIKAENIINEQITALRSIVVNNANMPANELDIDEVVGQIGLKVDEYLASSKIYGQADMAVVDTINKSEESYYLNTEDENSIKYFSYVAEKDSFKPINISLFFEHLLHKGIKCWAYTSEPYKTIWFSDNEGNLRSISYDADNKVCAGARHNVGGKIISMAVIPEPLGNYDELWLVVERVINNETVYYTERLSWGLPQEEVENEYKNTHGVFCDCAKVFEFEENVASVSGLEFLEGKTIKVVVDGKIQTDKVVVNGEINLDTAGKVIVVGLGYDWLIETLYINLGANDGTSQGLPQRVAKVVARCIDTRFLTAKATNGNRYEVICDKEVLTDDDFEIHLPSDYSRQMTLFFAGIKPVSATILAIVAEMKTYQSN